jgi:hypothetical protein
MHGNTDNFNTLNSSWIVPQLISIVGKKLSILLIAVSKYLTDIRPRYSMVYNWHVHLAAITMCK